MKIITPLSVFLAALMLGGFVTPILAFLFVALVIDLAKAAFPAREPGAVRIKARPF